jgi:uncharacterized RDD family membrane protein YckC
LPPSNDLGSGLRYYARASVRVRAALTDSVVFGVSLLMLLLLFEAMHLASAVAMPLFFTWVVAFVVYEPVLVSWRGATIGHMAYNLRVLDRRTGRPPTLPKAIVRTFIKSLLGLVSFVAMSLTRQHQALHDLATGTVVEIADPSRVNPADAVMRGN